MWFHPSPAEKLHRRPADIRRGFARADAEALVRGLGLGAAEGAVAATLAGLYAAYAASDAELLEINPLAVTRDGGVIALDCKLVVDDCALARRPALARAGSPDPLTDLEARAKAVHLKYIDLGGEVGVLANGSRCSYLPPREVYGTGIYQETIAVLAPGCLETLIDDIAGKLGEWLPAS